MLERYFFQERGSEVAEELERKAHNFLTDVKSKKKPALQVRPLRLPQVFYNQGLSRLCRCVSYVRAEH